MQRCTALWMRMYGAIVPILVIMSIILLPLPCAAQEPLVPTAGDEEEGEGEAQVRETQPALQGSSGVGGFGAMAPGTWGLIQASLRNPLETEQQVRLVFQFSAFPQRQFIRIASLPPRSTRSVELPARPGPLAPDAKSADTEILLFPVDRDLEMGRATGSAIVRASPSPFAIIGDSGGNASEQERIGRIDEEADDVLSAVRKQAGHEQDKLYPTVPTTPRFDIAWDAAYLTAITADDPAFDAAQRRALRRWIARGGVLVAFLDQVDNETMAETIGEAWDIAAVDQVSLTHVKFQEGPGADGGAFELGAPPAPLVAEMSTEKPIAFTRIIAPAPEWQTHLTVNGWPALVTKRLGRGTLVAITVGGRAWTAPPVMGGADGKQVVKPGTVQALDKLTAALLPIESQAMARAEPATLMTREPGRDFLTRLIGYEVVSRGWVALVMGLFLGTFLLAGVYWHRQGVGERLGIAAVFLAIAASAVLVFLGVKQRGQIAPSAASLQLAEVQPGLSSVHVTGPAALYHPQKTQVTIAGRAGGWLWPVEVSEAGDMQRLRTDDLDRWSWVDLSVAAGVPRPLDVSVDVEVDRPFVSDVRFTEAGLTGQVQWPIDKPFEDMLLATPQANLLPRISREGEAMTLTVGPQDVLAPREFYRGVLTQEQQDRAALLGGVFRVSRFDQPTLLAWSEGLDLSYDITPKLERIDRALWAAPMSVERSKPGEKVTIPWPLVPMQQIRNTHNDASQLYGFTTMPLYQQQGRLDDTDGDQKPDTLVYWIAGNNPSGFIGRFMLPPQVLPLKVERATVHLNIQAIGRPVRILAIHGDKAIELAKLDGPDGDTRIEVDAGQLAVDPQGGVLLAFDVQNAANAPETPRPASMTAMWQVRHFGLEVAGTVQGK